VLEIGAPNKKKENREMTGVPRNMSSKVSHYFKPNVGSNKNPYNMKTGLKRYHILLTLKCILKG
jgi:hypothetical protein